MKVHELLAEAADLEQLSPITVTQDGDKFTVNTTAKAGPTLDTMHHIWKDFGNKHGFEIFSKSGKPVDKYGLNGRPNGFVIKAKNPEGVKEKIESSVENAVAKVVKAQKAKVAYKASAPQRKKEMAQWAAERRKDDLAKYDKEFGKGTWKRVTYKQEGGDDGYQYVLRIDGRPKLAGLTQREAEYEKRKAVDNIAKNEKLGKYAGETK